MYIFFSQSLLHKLLIFFPHSICSASEHAFKKILTGLPKPGGGEFGKFYSLPSLNDPKIGMQVKCTLGYICK